MTPYPTTSFTQMEAAMPRKNSIPPFQRRPQAQQRRMDGRHRLVPFLTGGVGQINIHLQAQHILHEQGDGGAPLSASERWSHSKGNT